MSENLSAKVILHMKEGDIAEQFYSQDHEPFVFLWGALLKTHENVLSKKKLLMQLWKHSKPWTTRSAYCKI